MSELKKLGYIYTSLHSNKLKVAQPKKKNKEDGASACPAYFFHRPRNKISQQSIITHNFGEVY